MTDPDQDAEDKDEDKWTCGYQQGRRDAAMSTRILNLETRFQKFELSFKESVDLLSTQMVTIARGLDVLSRESFDGKTKWERWRDWARWAGVLLYRITMVLGWLSLLVSHPEVAKASSALLFKLIFW